jgi:hypothetical protein
MIWREDGGWGIEDGLQIQQGARLFHPPFSIFHSLFVAQAAAGPGKIPCANGLRFVNYISFLMHP